MAKNSKFADVDDVDRLKAEIAKEIEASETAQRAVARLEVEEDAALIAGDVDRKMSIRRELGEAEDAIRRTSLVLPGLREQLAAAIAAKRDAQFMADVELYRQEVAAFAAPYEAVLAAVARIDHALQRAHESGGQRAMALPLPPRLPNGVIVLAPDLIRRWMDTSQRFGAPEQAPGARKAATAQKSAPSPAGAQRPANLAAAAPQPAPWKPFPPHKICARAPEPDGRGRGNVIITMALAANSAIQPGDVVSLPFDQCMALVRGSRAAFVELDGLAEPPREVADAFTPITHGVDR